MPEATVVRLMREKEEKMSDDSWMPSLPFPLTDREKKERRDQEREKNRIKNANRRKAKAARKNNSRERLEAGKQLRHAFGGAFGRAKENVKFMASQGTAHEIRKIPREEKEED
jgi:hypothetical protein